MYTCGTGVYTHCPLRSVGSLIACTIGGETCGAALSPGHVDSLTSISGRVALRCGRYTGYRPLPDDRTVPVSGRYPHSPRSLKPSYTPRSTGVYQRYPRIEITDHRGWRSQHSSGFGSLKRSSGSLPTRLTSTTERSTSIGISDSYTVPSKTHLGFRDECISTYMPSRASLTGVQPSKGVYST